MQQSCLPSFFVWSDFLRNACDGPRGRVPHKHLSTSGRLALRSGHSLALQAFVLGHVGEDWILLSVPAGGGSGRERCMYAIGRLLDDAATCFFNWSSVMSATGTLYLALCSSRLQMYRNKAPTVGDALLLLLFCDFTWGFAPAELLLLLLPLLFLSGQQPAVISGVKRAAARPRPRLVRCVCF